jgi:hypothetical protein
MIRNSLLLWKIAFIAIDHILIVVIPLMLFKNLVFGGTGNHGKKRFHRKTFAIFGYITFAS